MKLHSMVAGKVAKGIFLRRVGVTRKWLLTRRCGVPLGAASGDDHQPASVPTRYTCPSTGLSRCSYTVLLGQKRLKPGFQNIALRVGKASKQSEWSTIRG